MKALETTNCLALEAPGGVDGVIYVGKRTDIASVTFGANGEVTALTLKASTYLRKYASAKETNDFKYTTVVQKPRNMFTQTATISFWPYTPLEHEAVQKLGLIKRAFVIYVTADNRVKVAGIDRNPWKPGDMDDERGLSGSIEGAEGIVFTDSKAEKVTFTGNFYEKPKLFQPAIDTEDIITTLDAMLETA
jgi:hypothetical protein